MEIKNYSIFITPYFARNWTSSGKAQWKVIWRTVTTVDCRSWNQSHLHNEDRLSYGFWFDEFLYICKLRENNILQLLVITLFKGFCVEFWLLIYIYTIHFVKHFKVFSPRVWLYNFLEWCLVEDSCVVMLLWSKSLVFRLFAFMIGGCLKKFLDFISLFWINSSVCGYTYCFLWQYM